MTTPWKVTRFFPFAPFQYLRTGCLFVESWRKCSQFQRQPTRGFFFRVRVFLRTSKRRTYKYGYTRNTRRNAENCEVLEAQTKTFYQIKYEQFFVTFATVPAAWRERV